MTQVLDYSGTPPRGADVAAAGFAGVIRYSVPGNSKSIAVTEVADMIQAGRTVTLVYEGQAGQILNGHTQGVHDAAQALRQAHNVGIDPRAMYFACDVDAQPDQYGLIDNYLDGAATQLGAARVGIYGGRQVIDHVRSAGTARWFWQTAAWGTGLAAGVHLYQRIGYVTVGGTQCDVNDVHQADYGQHPAPASIPAPPVKEWFQMPLDATAKTEIRGIVDDALAEFLASEHFKNAIVADATKAALQVVRREGISGAANVAKKALAEIAAIEAQEAAEVTGTAGAAGHAAVGAAAAGSATNASN